MPHFRGCSGELNLAPRAYHSGDYEEVEWILQRMAERRGGPVLAVGISLGGNMLLRWAEESGAQAAQQGARRSRRSARRSTWPPAATPSAAASALHTYTRMFLGTMKPKALAKLRQHPGPVRRAHACAPRATSTSSTTSSPRRCTASATPTTTGRARRPSRRLSDIRIPALVLNALNDPFVPGESLPKQSEVGAHVTLWQPRHGGHVGFADGRLPPGNAMTMPTSVFGWLKSHNH